MSRSSSHPSSSVPSSRSFVSNSSTKSSFLPSSESSATIYSTTSSNSFSTTRSTNKTPADVHNANKDIVPLRWDSPTNKFISLGFPAIEILSYLPNFCMTQLIPVRRFPDIVGDHNISVLVKSMKKSDKGVEYKVGVGQRMAVIYEDYSNRLDCKGKDITLYYMGRQISPLDTPTSLRLVGYEIIYEIGNVPNLNTDTHVKYFTIEEMVSKPRLMTYIADRLSKCRTLYNAWAEYTEVDPSRIYLVCDNRVLRMDETVESANIKNDDRVVAMDMQLLM